MSDDRDRVRAIFDAPCDCDKPVGVTGVGHRDWCRGYTDESWLAGLLLEALDTIDKARELHRPTRTDSAVCAADMLMWPCPTRQALNGGNE